MSGTTVYGIKNCDTMKKAFKWMDKNNVSYDFHDYKKQGIDKNVLAKAIELHGWENVINRRGTTWRKLPDNIKNTMGKHSAITCASENSSLIKRPLIIHGRSILLGFDETTYDKAFR